MSFFYLPDKFRNAFVVYRINIFLQQGLESSIRLTLYFIMLKNGQTLLTPQDF